MLLLASLGLALGAAEVVVRTLHLAPQIRKLDISGPGDLYQWSDNPLLGYELRPDAVVPRGDPPAQIRLTNSHGMRDIERVVDKQPGVRRVILLGDSVVEDIAKNDISTTMSQQLEKLYEGENVEVLNFGVAGYCTLGEAEMFERKALQFQPDEVVVVFVANDFDNFNSEGILAHLPAHLQFTQKVSAYSHLVRLIAWRLGAFDAANPLTRSKGAVGDGNVAAGIKRLRELALEHGFEISIAVWPGFYEGTIRDAHFVSEGGPLIIERLAEFYGIPCFRLSPVFRRHWNENDPDGRPIVLYSNDKDGMHPNHLGSRVAAAAIKEICERVTSGPNPNAPVVSVDPSQAAALEAGADRNDSYDVATALAHIARAYAHRPHWHRHDSREYEMRYVQAALRADPNNLAARVGLASALLTRGDADGAVWQCEEALRRHPDSTEARKILGMALLQAGKPRVAPGHLESVLGDSPGDAEVIHAMAVIMTQLQRFDQAVKYYRTVLKYRSLRNDASVHSNLGVALARVGRVEQAEAAFRRALQLNPDYAPAYNSLGPLLVRSQRTQQAVTLFQQAVKRIPNDPGLHNNLGACLELSGHLDQAAESYRRALRLAPRHPQATAGLRRIESKRTRGATGT